MFAAPNGSRWNGARWRGKCLSRHKLWTRPIYGFDVTFLDDVPDSQAGLGRRTVRRHFFVKPPRRLVLFRRRAASADGGFVCLDRLELHVASICRTIRQRR